MLVLHLKKRKIFKKRPNRYLQVSKSSSSSKNKNKKVLLYIYRRIILFL
ncbi:MAG TPA: hypothetical protein VIY08_07855 [Candidatus Nitrosocosmicus sp.]